MNDVTSFDVIIVGAGLVGATAAALLASQQSQSALRIAIVDPASAPKTPNLDSEKPQFDTRVVALTRASRQILERIGAWQGIEAMRACAYRDMHVWDDQGTASLHFSAAELQRDNLGHIVENSIALANVLAVIENISTITLLRGVGVESIDYQTQDQQQLCLTLTDQQQLAAPLVVAADGAHSTLRSLAKIPLRQWDYHHKAIVATVKTSKSHQATAWQNFLTTGPLAFLPLGYPGNHYSSIVWSLEDAVADELMAASDDEFKKRLGRAFEHRLGDVEWVDQRFCFPLTQRHAIDYYADNLVLLGDAAHTIHPLAGQGVNLGLLDAMALAQEIDRAQRRGLSLGDPSVLRRYQRQRKGHNLEVMALMEGLKRLFGSDQIWVRFVRNVGLAKVDQLKPLKHWLARQAMG